MLNQDTVILESREVVTQTTIFTGLCPMWLLEASVASAVGPAASSKSVALIVVVPRCRTLALGLVKGLWQCGGIGPSRAPGDSQGLPFPCPGLLGMGLPGAPQAIMQPSLWFTPPGSSPQLGRVSWGLTRCEHWHQREDAGQGCLGRERPERAPLASLGPLAVPMSQLCSQRVAPGSVLWSAVHV